MKCQAVLVFFALSAYSATAFVPSQGLGSRYGNRHSSALHSLQAVKHVPARRASHVLVALAEDQSQNSDAYTLVLVRHGESTWNDENRFTGWADVPLSEKGEKEAKQCGEIIRDSGYTFDLAYTSFLKGLDKQETVDKHGKEQVLIWRRSYDIPPPELEKTSEHYPGNDRRYQDIPEELLPTTESLAMTKERFLVEWEEGIVPDIKSGKRVLIAAHGNTLRALVQYLDDIPNEVITGLNIPTGVPLIYQLDKETLKPIAHPDAMAPLSGHYLGDMAAINERIASVKAQTK